jgi:hypothetical protein
MSAIEPRRCSWQHNRPLWPDADSCAHIAGSTLDELRQHRPRCLADGDDVGRGSTCHRISDGRVAERGANDHRRIGRTHSCEQDAL